MRSVCRAVLALGAAPNLAAAQPAVTAPQQSAPGTLQGAVRVGVGPADFNDGDGCVTGGDGYAGFAELEGGFRMPPYVTAGVFASYGLLHSTLYGVDQKARYVDYGLRASATYKGAYAGLGLGEEELTAWREHFGDSSLLVELHAGYALPITQHLAIDMRVLYSRTTNDHEHTARFTVGVQN